MKFIGAISSVVAGIMAIVGLSVACLTEYSANFSGWDIIKTANDEYLTLGLTGDAGFVLFKIFAIVGLIFGIILILYGLFLLLIDLKVIKIKSKINFYIFNNILLTLFVICALLAFIGVWVMKGDALVPDKTHIGVGAWLMFIIPAVLCVLCWLFSRKQSKK